MADDSLIRIPPFQYVHILDNNSNLTRVIEGPLSYVLQDHERCVSGKTCCKMVQIPPRSYCVIRNPVVRNQEGELVIDQVGMVKVKYGDLQVRTSQTHSEPFPLYPLQELSEKLQKIPVIQPNHAIKLLATRDFTDQSDNFHQAGDQWLHLGPCSYIPRIECEILCHVKPLTIKPNTALKLRARRKMKDWEGNQRIAGQEWLVRETGDYLPQVQQEVIQEVKAQILTDKRALHLRALKSCTDIYGIERKAGEEWLVTLKMSDTHIPDISEEVVGTVNAIILSNREYCYILDPVDSEGNNQYGKRELRKGELTFFLKPHESLQRGTQSIFVLSEDEALLLKAIQDFEDQESHKAGERWMIYGPCDYIPPIEIEVLESRKSIPLDENEGIYVRDTSTGEVKAVTGESYMLKPYEELWEMELNSDVQELIGRQVTGETFQVASSKGKGRDIKYSESKPYVRDKTRVVSFRVPHNSAVQVYDYKLKKNRVVFGPDRIMLQPDEQFTVLNLSGGIPKQENRIKNLALMLGPDFMSDRVIVQTADHASLALILSYNWYFDIDKENQEECNKIFQVRDFVGDACKSLASRVRGAVSAYSFEDFHQKSSDIIKAAVFGRTGDEIRDRLELKANKLVISNVDLQSQEPTDEKMRDSLKKSVNQAIEITTEASKARAEHEARKADEHSKGLLELQKVHDSIISESEKIKLLQLQTRNKEIQLINKATSEALAQAKSKKVEYESMVEQTELTENAKKIQREAELAFIKENNEASISHAQALNELEVNKARELANIETEKFQQIVDAIGRETIVSMAKAGPEMQSRLLKGLGLKGFMIMNSSNPINLFSTASGFVNQQE